MNKAERQIEEEFDKAFTPELSEESKQSIQTLMDQTKTCIKTLQKNHEADHEIITVLKAAWADMYWTLHDQDTIYRV